MLTTSINLLERVRRREDREAWERFAALYSPLLYRWALSAGMPAQEASDLVQDVFLLLVETLPTFQYDRRLGTFKGWLKTLTVRQALERMRRWNPAAPSGEGADLERSLEDSANTFWGEEYRQFLVRRALQLMQSDFADATWRACWEHTVGGRTAAEVGRELGLSEGAVYVSKSRVLRRLRDEMADLLD